MIGPCTWMGMMNLLITVLLDLTIILNNPFFCRTLGCVWTRVSWTWVLLDLGIFNSNIGSQSFEPIWAMFRNLINDEIARVNYFYRILTVLPILRKCKLCSFDLARDIMTIAFPVACSDMHEMGRLHFLNRSPRARLPVWQLYR